MRRFVSCERETLRMLLAAGVFGWRSWRIRSVPVQLDPIRIFAPARLSRRHSAAPLLRMPPVSPDRRAPALDQNQVATGLAETRPPRKANSHRYLAARESYLDTGAGAWDYFVGIRALHRIEYPPQLTHR